MTTSLYSLLYTSQARAPFSVDELDELLIIARGTNHELGITGMLVHLSGAFMQVLEGPQDAVVDLFYQKINLDDRHFGVEVATEGFIDHRQFSEWSMAFDNLDDRFEARPEGFSDFSRQGFTTELSGNHQDLSIAYLGQFRKLFGDQKNARLLVGAI